MFFKKKLLLNISTCRCSIADREGVQRGVQAVDSVMEMLSKEDMALHWLASNSM